MDKIRELVKPFFDMINGFLEPIMTKVTEFLLLDMRVLYAVIFVFVGLLALIGLIAFIKKAPKLFFVLLIILAIFLAAWFFLYYK